jgi:glycogen synthase
MIKILPAEDDERFCMRKGNIKTLFLTNEYPPHIYGGAGIHAAYLSRELARLCRVDVRCFGDQKKRSGSLTVTGYGASARKRRVSGPVLNAVQRCLDFNADSIDADVVHAHTWYTHLGGILAKWNCGIPLVLTAHSLEPLRPWKREQLGGGYDFSCWIEKTAIEAADAVVAVSQEAKRDILRLFEVNERKIHVIHNGVDTEEYRPVRATGKLKKLGIDPARPYVLFVGRITRQKGIVHLVNAVKYMDPDFQVVLCAGAPDTKEIEHEMKSRVEKARRGRGRIVWIQNMLEGAEKVAVYSHASLFCCPSIYEPFGIINLEAMACEIPVVASAVGGIREVVLDGKTGVLVPVRCRKVSPFEPVDPEKFSRDLARQINRLMGDPALRLAMGKAGRERAVRFFSWRAIAKKVHSLYCSLLGG